MVILTYLLPSVLILSHSFIHSYAYILSSWVIQIILSRMQFVLLNMVSLSQLNPTWISLSSLNHYESFKSLFSILNHTRQLKSFASFFQMSSNFCIFDSSSYFLFSKIIIFTLCHLHSFLIILSLLVIVSHLQLF